MAPPPRDRSSDDPTNIGRHESREGTTTLPSARMLAVPPIPASVATPAPPLTISTSSQSAHGPTLSRALLALGGEVLKYEPPQLVRVRFPFADYWSGLHGALSSGFLAAMIDSVVCVCCQTIDPNRSFAVLEHSNRFFRTIRAGHVIVDGTVLRAGHTTSTIECIAWDDAGTMCAKGTATCLFVG